MSQAFIDSGWCQYEFKSCYVERMKDPAFRLFIIMVQPVEERMYATRERNTFFRNRTYLVSSPHMCFEKYASTFLV